MWHMGSMQDKTDMKEKPAMQIVSYWYVTNLSNKPLRLLNAKMNYAVLNMVSIHDSSGSNNFGDYPIMPNATAEVIIDSWITPPKCKEKKDFKE